MHFPRPLWEGVRGISRVGEGDPVPDVKLATTDADIARCFAVMRQLRPHLKNEAEFIAREIGRAHV